MSVKKINKNRIAIYIPSLSGGGAERVMVTLANNFAHLGYEVDLILARAEGPYLSEVDSAVRVCALKTRRSWLILPLLTWYLRREAPVCILSAMGHANVMSILAKKLARINTRVVISERNTFSLSRQDTKTWLARYLLPKLMAKTYPYADGVIAVSKGVALDLAESLKFDLLKIDVVYNPVVSDWLISESNQVPDHAWLKDKHLPVIVAAGRLVKQKNFSMLLESFSILLTNKKARLLILGQGPMYAELTQLIHKLGIQEYVELLGFVKNPFVIMRHADLFVLSSLWEGLPNVLIQAMACGTPVVATDCPSGPSEILDGGLWGKLVPVSDVNALAQAMSDTLENKFPPKVSERAADFNVEQAVNGYLKIMLPNSH